jgi:hypothetical protein
VNAADEPARIYAALLAAQDAHPGGGVSDVDYWTGAARALDLTADCYERLAEWASATRQPSAVYLAASAAEASYRRDAREARRDAERARREAAADAETRGTR